MKVFSSVIVRLLKSRAVHHVSEIRSLASGARISAGTFTGDNYFTKVDRVEMMMREVAKESSIPLDRMKLLLQAVSRLFEERFAGGGVRQGEALHCLTIKLGIESSLASGARISAGTFTGDNYFTKVDRVEMMMREVAEESSIPLDRMRLLLQAVSRLFEEGFADGDVTKGEPLHCLTIKLGIESHLHRNLITLYGRELATNRENIRKVFQIIRRASFYKSLNSMVHAFAYMCPKDAYAAFGMIVKLGVPNEENISGLIDAKKNDSLMISKPWRVDLAGENIKMYMKHYRIPFTPRIYGALGDLYAKHGLISNALQTLLEMPKIDDIGITSFLSGCLKHEDMTSASTLVRYLEKNGVIYTLDETMMRKLTIGGIGVKFGENVMIEEKIAGWSQLQRMRKVGNQQGE